MKMAPKMVRRLVLTALISWLFSVSSVALARPDSIPASIRNTMNKYAQIAAQSGGEVCETVHLNHNIKKALSEVNIEGKVGIKGRINVVIGGRNFTAADVDTAEVPFFCPASGLGDTAILHDGGIWPGTGGDTNRDDGRQNAGNDWAGEFYDLDGNHHYPKAVLRYVGSHCYIFVPTMFFPTLPKGISATEQTTPAADPAWGMIWPDTQGWGADKLYFAIATGVKTLEPRYCLGSDKNLARLKLKELADEFDGNIYPRIREFFGSEPDVDGDPKIFIILDDLRDGQGSLRGYVWKANELPNAVFSKSNEKELVHLDLFPTFLQNAKAGYRTTAHEFTHLIAFNNGDIVDGANIDQQETWLEEGYTQYASYVYDKSQSTNVDAFIKNPDTQLNNWDNGLVFAHYGASFMFMFYLMEHYGATNGPTFMRNMVKSKLRGVATVNDAVKGFNTTFNDVFADWAVANFLDKTRKMDSSPLNDGKWGYLVDNDFDTTNNIGVNESLPVKFSERVILTPAGAARSGEVYPYASDYLEFSGNTGNLNIGFDGDDKAQFKAAIIKRGPQVDPTVEFIYLNEKQSGNLIIQNYGAGNTYENLVMLPMIVDSGDTTRLNYVYSATFADLKVGMFPNPIFENNLHIITRTSDKFSATPRLQITFMGQQGYLVMTPVNDSTYITNYELKNSGEGEIEAFGTTSNGTILSNRMKFSAVYYPPKSAGALSASFGSLTIPEGAIKTGGLFILTSDSGRTSFPGLVNFSNPINLSFPSGKSDLPLPLKVPLLAGLKGGEGGLGLFDVSSGTPRFISKVENQNGFGMANITKAGNLIIAADSTSPKIGTEFEPAGERNISIALDDLGSGIDPKTVQVIWQNFPVLARYDEATKRIVLDVRNMPRGSWDFEISAADFLGNMSKSRVSALVAGPLSMNDLAVYPSPARSFAKFRAVYSGASSLGLLVEAKVRDFSGAEVFSTDLRHDGSGVYEYTWNLRNNDGEKVANGVYILEIITHGDGDDRKERRKFAVLQ